MPGQSFRKTTRPTLYQLLEKFSASEANKPRDKVYALKSLSCDAAEDSILRHGYSKDIGDFISDVTSFLVCPDTASSKCQVHPNWTWGSFMKIFEEPKRGLECQGAIEFARIKIQALQDVLSPDSNRLYREKVLAARITGHSNYLFSEVPFVVILNNTVSSSFPIISVKSRHERL